MLWQFIVNRYNEHELDKAALMAKELDIFFSPVKMDMNEGHPDFISGGDLAGLKIQWLPSNQDFIEERYKDKQIKPHSDLYCEFLFAQPVITPDGNVYPCCLITDEMNAYGNINYESFEEIWNNEIFTSARNLFRKKKNSSSSIETICHHCQCGCGEENSSTSPGS